VLFRSEKSNAPFKTTRRASLRLFVKAISIFFWWSSWFEVSVYGDWSCWRVVLTDAL
jgi:hypothetical protein